LLRKENEKKVSNIKNINYQVYFNKTEKEFVYNKIENDLQNDVLEISSTVNISPMNFVPRSVDSLMQTNHRWFVNLSSFNIPEEISNLLQLGEGFSIPVFKNKKELVIEFIKDMEGKDLRRNNDQKLLIKNIAINKLQKFLNNKQQLNNIQKELIRLGKITRSFCKDNSNVIFTKADKGNVTVALDRAHYFESMNKMLDDKTTYQKINKNPVKNLELKLNNMLKRWLTLGFITKHELYSLRGSDCALPKAYGLPKIHKENIPFRIIVSSINTSLYPISNYLQKILNESLPPANCHIKNSFDLFNTLLGRKIPENQVLISLDVQSLFTNVPEELVLEAINNRWDHIKEKTKITKKEFIIAVKFILNSTFFTFDKVTYRQIFGTPMGSPCHQY